MNKFKRCFNELKLYYSNNHAELLLLITAIAISCMVVVPFLLASTYANPYADDFSNGHIVARYAASITGAFQYVKDVYLKTQGTYTGAFLIFILTPVFRKFGLLGIHLEYLLTITLFYCSTVFMFYHIFRNMLEKRSMRFAYSLLASSMLLFILVSGFDVGEVFYWNTGVCVYTIPLTAGLLLAGLSFDKSSSKATITLGCLLAFFAVGGALDIAALVCGINLCIILYKSIYAKRDFKNSLVFFLVALVGSICNCAAPGNFTRYDRYGDDGLQIMKSISASFEYSDFVFGILCQYYFPIIIILFAISLFNKLKKVETRYVHPFWAFIVLCVGAALVSFPVYLGYHGGYMPIRAKFVSRFTLELLLIIFVINFVGWASKRNKKDFIFTKEIIAVLILISFVPMTNIGSRYYREDTLPFKIYHDISSGKLKEFETANRYIIEQLEQGEGEDVVINVGKYDTLKYMTDLGLTPDKDHWVNISIAQYYNLNSVVLNTNQ